MIVQAVKSENINLKQRIELLENTLQSNQNKFLHLETQLVIKIKENLSPGISNKSNLGKIRDIEDENLNLQSKVKDLASELTENQIKFAKEKSDANKLIVSDIKHRRRELGKEKKQKIDLEKRVDELNSKSKPSKNDGFLQDSKLLSLSNLRTIPSILVMSPESPSNAPPEKISSFSQTKVILMFHI